MLNDLFAPRYASGFDRSFDRMVDDMARLFNQSWATPWRTSAAGGFPASELWTDEKGETAALTLEVPGCRAEDIEVSVVGSSLTIKGRRTVELPEKGATWLLRERADAEWNQTVNLPFDVEAGQEKASFRDGVLCITLKRSGKDAPRRIPLSDR
ncbi:MAG TPA: Hsp20/alpha crystallin family protein [Planctomycetota bacterium]|nr:Hsp20/alpha crystallin family protein [Planctomycetota bacterium]